MKHRRAQIDTWLAENFRSDPAALRLAAQIADEEWALLETYPDLAEAPVPELGKRVRLMRALSPRPSVTSTELESTVTALRTSREQAMADVLARHVTCDVHFGVSAFRHEVLEGVLVPTDGVAEWITARKHEPGPPAEYLAIGPDGTGQFRRHVLRYERPEPGGTFSVATTLGSVLERLRGVSTAVAGFCNWSESAATQFVLTGEVPPMATVTGQFLERSPLTARSRIVLTIDPSCTPKEVERGYRGYRDAHFWRIRRLTPRRAALAAFADEHRGQPWADIRTRWRERKTPPAGASVADFQRQAEQALETLTELPLKRTAPRSNESVIAPQAMNERNEGSSGHNEPQTAISSSSD